MGNLGKIMGIDYGDARIGVALSNPEKQIAFGREMILNKSKKAAIHRIKQICKEDKVDLIILGLPLSMEGEESEQTEKVIRFGKSLAKAVEIPVEYHDERLTTYESNGILASLGMSGRDKKKERDIIAASLILQNYLDSILTDKGGKGR